MDIQTFIQNFKEAFGENAELPLVFWYSDEQKGETEKINGCFFKGMKTVRDGGIISLNAENIGCGGGKFYTGFTEMPERVPTFVSLKEKYKQTPEMVIDFIQQIGVPRTENKYLHFARIDKVESLEEIEGVVFTMYDARTNLSLQVVENVKDNLQQNIYKTIIPRNIRLAEAPSYGLPINKYDPKSTGAESYMRLADEVIERERIKIRRFPMAVKKKDWERT